MSILLRIAQRALSVPARRGPDFVIGGLGNPYLLRWYLIPKNRVFNVYLHLFNRSDDDRALHDHPWWNLSFLLQGRYVEYRILAGGVNTRTERSAGAIVLRRACVAHRIELYDGPCWTLFLTGPKVRDWGFHCPRRWVPWQQFVDMGETGKIGPGCGE